MRPEIQKQLKKTKCWKECNKKSNDVEKESILNLMKLKQEARKWNQDRGGSDKSDALV